MTDDELNAAVAVEVMGWTWRPAISYAKPEGWVDAEMKTWARPESWGPATNIVDAFEMVGRMPGQWSLDRVLDTWSVRYKGGGGQGLPHRPIVAVAGAFLPRAICEAALAAVRSQ
jgi:hypothetical protein